MRITDRLDIGFDAHNPFLLVTLGLLGFASRLERLAEPSRPRGAAPEDADEEVMRLLLLGLLSLGCTLRRRLERALPPDAEGAVVRTDDIVPRPRDLLI